MQPINANRGLEPDAGATGLPQTKPIAASLLQVLLFAAVCLPTGSIFGLNVKILVFLAFFAAFLFYVGASSVRLTSAECIFAGLFIAALCFWSLVAIFNGQSETAEVFLQIKEIASTIVIAWACIFFVRRRLLRPESIVYPIVYGIAILSIMKIALIVAMFVSGINPIQVIESIFGEQSLLGAPIAFGLSRLEFSPDIIGCFALFAILCPSVSGLRFRRIPITFIVLVLLASGVLAYSRYLWALDVSAITAAMIVERRWKLLAAFALAVAIIAGTSYATLQPLFETRFTEAGIADSDVIRVEEARALFEEIKARPFFGKGFGTHADGVIRSDTSRYSYELQWMSLSMQFGAAGVMGILLLIGISARDLVASRHRAKPWMMFLFMLWLLSAWTNPYLTTSFAGAMFGMFMAMFYNIRHPVQTSDAA